MQIIITNVRNLFKLMQNIRVSRKKSDFIELHN